MVTAPVAIPEQPNVLFLPISSLPQKSNCSEGIEINDIHTRITATGKKLANILQDPNYSSKKIHRAVM